MRTLNHWATSYLFAVNFCLSSGSIPGIFFPRRRIHGSVSIWITGAVRNRNEKKGSEIPVRRLGYWRDLLSAVLNEILNPLTAIRKSRCPNKQASSDTLYRRRSFRLVQCRSNQQHAQIMLRSANPLLWLPLSS
jgi:hypothetical protein